MMRATLLVLLAALTASHASAAPLCVSAPLSTYTAMDFECEVDSMIFSNFQFSIQNDSSDTVPLTEDEITVSPLSLAGQAGLRFAGEFEAVGAENGPGPAEGVRNVSYRLFFDVTRPGSLITAVTAALNDPVRFAPNLLKFGDIFSALLAGGDGASAIVNDDDPGFSETADLFMNRVTVFADALISLSGGASADGTEAPVGFVSLGSTDYLFAYEEQPIPEPSSWILVGCGVFAIAARGRKLRG